jgi:hypothetical protein
MPHNPQASASSDESYIRGSDLWFPIDDGQGLVSCGSKGRDTRLGHVNRVSGAGPSASASQHGENGMR